VIVTCPGCQTRYRVDAQALTTPGGRTVRCAACGLSWHHPPAALETGPREPAMAEPPPLEPTLAAPPPSAPPLEPTLAPPTRPEPSRPTPGTRTPASDRPWASLLAAEETGEDGPPNTRPVEAAPRRRRWLTVVVPMLVVLIVLLAALYLARP
jgi:predicted Zn finger-like uncharacterized protein